MKQNKKTAPAELSYYGLYLLDYLRKYHPDKVNSLGEDVKKSATEKFRAINEAYEQLKKDRSFV